LASFDGFQLCEILRRDSVTSTVPILVVTTTQPRLLDRARTAGADSVLTKPVKAQALLDEVQRLLHPTAAPDRPPHDPEPLPLQRHISKTKAHRRVVTTAPPTSPPLLRCPSCDGTLHYEHSFIGGVSATQTEQWDIYTCDASCGRFEYRQRTRKLRRVDKTDAP
jgi:hypothetical protein